MDDLSRSGSVGHKKRVRELAGGLVLGLCAACTGAPGGGGDQVAPVFAGLESAEPAGAGTAHLTWSAAEDESTPITYQVYSADSPGSQAFSAAPIATTEALELDLAGLPQGAMPTYFVVRAMDAAGNEDGNDVEKSVAFSPNRLELLAQYETPTASDIAVNEAGTLVAMGGFITSPQVRAWVFDVTDPGNPQLKSTLYGPGRSTDVEIRGNVLWVSTEGDSSSPQGGAYAYDLTDPDDIVEIGVVSGPGVGECHTIWIDQEILYCASSEDLGGGSAEGAIHLVDVADPANPVHLSSVGIPSGQVHDMYVSGDFAVGAFLWDGWAFLDVSDKMNPVLGPQVYYAGAFTHNAWPTPDLEYLYTTDENSNGHLRIWDIRNRDQVVQVGEYIADPGAARHAIVHNVQIVGNYAWVAWYEAGIHVLDITDPTDPVLVGFYDTFPQETQGWFAGAWGVAPKPPYVYVSDYSTGLYTFELTP